MRFLSFLLPVLFFGYSNAALAADADPNPGLTPKPTELSASDSALREALLLAIRECAGDFKGIKGGRRGKGDYHHYFAAKHKLPGEESSRITRHIHHKVWSFISYSENMPLSTAISELQSLRERIPRILPEYGTPLRGYQINDGDIMYAFANPNDTNVFIQIYRGEQHPSYIAIEVTQPNSNGKEAFRKIRHEGEFETNVIFLADGTKADPKNFTGKGTRYWEDGHSYNGTWINGVPHGTGMFRFPAQEIQYEGTVKNGQISGVGKLFYKSGRYEGEVDNGMANGKGSYYWYDYKEYTNGLFRDGKAVEGQSVDVPRDNGGSSSTSTASGSCSACSGKGSVQVQTGACSSCHGTGRNGGRYVKDTYSNSTHWEHVGCTACSGTGYNTTWQTCSSCSGSGRN